MRILLSSLAVIFALGCVLPLHAGVHYSGEKYAELPSQWRGFLLDQRKLRTIAVIPSTGTPASPLRKQYQAEAEKLTKLAGKRPLTADESADRGALLLRLGETARAIDVLRSAQREHPKHFALAANLGTAWQMQGDLAQATVYLEQAVRLAPAKLRSAEQAHLRVIRLRAREPRDAQTLDDLFGSSYAEPGRLTEAERKRLPADAIAVVQQLALWLPADGRLLWQLGELAGANGDVATAAAILDGCVTEFGMRADTLRTHRRAYRSAVAEQAKSGNDTKKKHEGHPGLFKPRSLRPFVRKLDATPLPPIDPKGVNVLPWSVVTETTLDRQYRPTFPRYLCDLDGKKVKLQGYLQLLGDDADSDAFLLIEYPVGCWYCEQPETTAILSVELPEGKTFRYTRDAVTVSGRLKLNASDPENFLYIIVDAEIRPAGDASPP